ncbi:hypothetical protein [Halovivax gelatinilyticus]|uniref:hypothetical protein n=1 Tax=Halovivax gelatinilyticus TaxID=2961597 RepID=UPI0020CA945C|nr:hypothetical protein [Halovivax gelatinilyticus]
MTGLIRPTRRERIVALEVACVLATLALVYPFESLVLWLAWGIGTVTVAGVTLVTFNWGLDPPMAE